MQENLNTMDRNEVLSMNLFLIASQRVRQQMQNASGYAAVQEIFQLLGLTWWPLRQALCRCLMST